MKIVNRNIKELISAEYNPRGLTDDQFRQLADSLKRFGIVDPVIVNKHPDRMDIIIGGHQRTKVWESLGNKKIPTVGMSLTLDREKELNVRLNKNTGHFDMDMLEEHFAQSELIEWGFQEHEFEMSAEIDIDEIPSSSGEEETTETNKIVLEYSDEDYEKVIQAFSDMGGIKENIVYKLLGLK